MTYQPDLADWPYAAKSEPAVSVTQALCAGLSLMLVNVALFVWLCGVAS